MTENISFSRFHPISLFFYYLALLLFTMFTQNPVIIACSLFGSLAFCFVTGSARENAKDTKFFALMFLLVALTNPLFSHGGATPLFFMNDNPVTLEAIAAGANLAAALNAVIFICKGFSRVMESDKLLALFGKISPKFAVVISMALRFLPLLARKWSELCGVHKAMGYFREESRFSRLRSYVRVFSALVSWALENAADTAASMCARGFELEGKKSFSLFRFTRADGALIALSAVFSVPVLAGFALGQAEFFFYPRISEVSFEIFSLIMYVSFALLAFIPFIFEVTEAVKWKYFRSKI
jgi:energy-coupling factor transport system permease protein